MRSTATVKSATLLKRDSPTHSSFYAEGNEKREKWESPHSLHLPFWGEGGRGGGSPTKFSKRGGRGGAWQDLNFFRGLLGKREVTFIKGSSNFYIKNKLKSEYLMTKKFINKNVFLCIAKNSNWEI